jgi:hypothetical protein
MQKAFVSLLLGVLTSLIATACGGGGSGGSDGILIQISTPQAQRSAPSGVQPNTSSLPQTAPSVQAPQASTGPAASACSLLTRADAAAALGAAVSEGRAREVPRQNLGVISVDISTCSYNVTNGPGQVGIETWKAPDLASIKIIATGTCQGREKANLGDTACWGDKEHTSIQVFKGTSFINMYIRSAPNEAAFFSLAQKVVAKL